MGVIILSFNSRHDVQHVQACQHVTGPLLLVDQLQFNRQAALQKKKNRSNIRNKKYIFYVTYYTKHMISWYYMMCYNKSSKTKKCKKV